MKRIQRYQEALQSAYKERPEIAQSPQAVRLGDRYGPRTKAAALLVAQALDLYLPMLRGAEAVGSPHHTAEGCDVLDALPVLCLGSAADNEYEESVTLLIDQGGDDIYRNSAGGTFTRPEHENAVVSTSVNVDLAGDDKYLADPKKANGTQPVDPLGEQPGREVVGAQGLGLSGLGLLFDATGDDEYLVSSPPPALDTYYSQAFGQGSGILGGTGLLLDEMGKDSYTIQGAGGHAIDGSVTGQAASDPGGLAVLADSGLGNETYVLDPGSVVQVVDQPEFLHQRFVLGQAAAGGSTSILYDDGGSDRFLITSKSTFVPTIDDFSRVTYPWLHSKGQGSLGAGGMALLITGLGDTTYEVEHNSVGGSGSWSQTQGFADLLAPGMAVISDQGGKDTYRALHTRNFDRRLVQTDACLCDAAEAVVNTLFWMMNDFVRAQGIGGGLGAVGVGMIQDEAGDDSYAVGVKDEYSLELIDKLKDPSLPPILRASIPRGHVEGQGLSWAGGNPPGLLLDQGSGTDTYDIFNKTSVRTKVKSRNWRGKPDMRVVAGGGPLLGQGNVQTWITQSALIDEGGKNDVITASNTVENLTLPDRDGSYEYSLSMWSPVQRGIYAAGEDPTITAATSVPACGDPGYHGFGSWSPCSPNSDDPDHDLVANGAGVGYAPLARGELPKLELFPVPEQLRADARGSSRFAVSARLTDPEGNPIRDVPVHFDLMIGYVNANPLSTVGGWWGLYQETPRTNAKGIARTRLPLLLLQPGGDDLIPDPATRFQVEATFDGNESFYPRHAAQPVEMLPPGPGRARQRVVGSSAAQRR